MPRWVTSYGYRAQYSRETCSSPPVCTTHELLNQSDWCNRVMVHQQHPFVPLTYRHASRSVVCTSYADVLVVHCQHNTELRTQSRKLSLIHISEPTRLGMISYAVFCLKK